MPSNTLKGYSSADAPEFTGINALDRATSIAQPLELKAVFSIADIEADWQDLERSAEPTPFQKLSWIKSILQTVCQDKPGTPVSKPLFITAYMDNKLMAVFPLVIEKSAFGKTVKCLGADVSDYNGMVVDSYYQRFLPSDFLDQVAACIRQNVPSADALYLSKIPQMEENKQIFRSKNAIYYDAEHSSHVLELTGDWKSLYAGLRSSKSRSRLRSKYRSLQSEGDVVFKRAGNLQDREAVTQQLLDWKSEQLNARGSRNPFGTRENPTELRLTLINSVLDDSPSSLSAFCLYSNGEPVAGILAFISGDTFYYLVAAYSTDVPAKYSIGTHLLVKTMEFSSRLGLKQYDFLIGDEPYKYEWADKLVVLKHLTIPLSLKGHLLCYGTGVYLGLKKYVVTSPQLNEKVCQLRKMAGNLVS